MKMADGSERLPGGTYVRVTKNEAGPDGGKIYIGRIVGTDMFASKYEIGVRYPGWNRWHFLDGGSWAFIGEVTVISEAEARAEPGEAPE
jgi:hypothetical protein